MYVVKNKFSNNLCPEFEFKSFLRDMYLSMPKWSSLSPITFYGIVCINNYCYPTYWRCETKWLQNFSIFIYSTQRISSEIISTLITQRACEGTKEESTVEKFKFGIIQADIGDHLTWGFSSSLMAAFLYWLLQIKLL